MIIDTTQTVVERQLEESSPIIACWNCGDIHIVPQGFSRLICPSCGWKEGRIEGIGNSWKYISLPNFNNIRRGER